MSSSSTCKAFEMATRTRWTLTSPLPQRHVPHVVLLALTFTVINVTTSHPPPVDVPTVTCTIATCVSSLTSLVSVRCFASPSKQQLMSRLLSGTTTAFPLIVDVAVWFVPTANPAESLALLVLETVACAWGCSTQVPLASGSNGLPFHLEVVVMFVVMCPCR